MAISDLICMYCGTTAFAAVNTEIVSGRARWPVCTRSECIERTMHEATKALHRAASNVSNVEVPARPDAIDTTARDPLDDLLRRAQAAKELVTDEDYA